MSLSPALAGELRSFGNHYGHRVAYYQSSYEPRAGEHVRPLVLLHSINAAASAYELRPLFDHFAQVRPTYALEWPGFGQSQRGPLDYGVCLYADTLREFLQLITAQHPAVDLVALSQSAEHAALVARQRPDLIDTLTLLSPTGLAAHPPRARRPSSLVRWFLQNKPWSQAIFSLLSSHASLRYFLSKSFVGPPDPGLLAYAYESSHQPGAEYAPFAFLAGRFAVPDVLGRVYAKLSIPTLVLYDQDAYTSFERLDELVQRNPAVHGQRIFPSRGLPQWDRPEQTLAALLEHQGRAEPAAAPAGTHLELIQGGTDRRHSRV